MNMMEMAVACLALGFGWGARAGDGNPRCSIMVSKVDREANWRGHWELGSAFTTLMSDALRVIARLAPLFHGA